MFVAYLIVLAVGYLLGALPFGYLVARAKGVNIFEVGSRNPGATNVRRVLGKGPGNLVFALDALKGAVASAWALLGRTEAVFTCEMPEWGLDFMVGGEGWTLLGVAGLVGAMLGHSFSCFTKFKGGKGVATGAGGIFVIIPVSALIAAAVWALVFFASRYVSLASMLAALSLPLTVWLRDRPPLVITLTALIALFVIFRHRENIKRLLNGTENRFVKKSPEEPKA
ncbi:MAG TPA: glycerol-3-phosphate 1-O-acyltransferase PlsY [Opitutaceae bacterium]|nr:glycerol-3-phosphate 1-O-acyltransferase PlsY [Opitutaceae bacterium]HRJ48010.1 glycerol-3-phosphate 1-O-acyltransferase PlsY [Opitutaceae bacterium]